MKILKNRKGFTLVEVIVVLVILGILLAIAIPNVTAYIKKANDKSDQLTARNIYLAAVTAASEYYGEHKAAPTKQADIDPEVRNLAGLDADTTYTITFNSGTDGERIIDSVTYNGVTYNYNGSVA